MESRNARLESRNAELETELDKVECERDMHENPNNPTRTGTVLAEKRRAFRAKEREKRAAALDGRKPEKDPERDKKDASPDSNADVGESEECMRCGTDKTCDLCKMEAKPPPVPADFGFDVDVSELVGRKDKVVVRRPPGHQQGVPGVSHNHKPDRALAVEFEQKTCGECGLTNVDLKTTYKTVREVVSGAIIGEEMDVILRIRQVTEAIKQKNVAGMDQDQLSALVDQIVEKVIKVISESTVCYTEKTTYAECHTCNVRTYPKGMHTIPGTSFGPKLREILINFHRMTTAVRSIQYGLKAIVGVLASTGAISNGLKAIAKYAEYSRMRKIPPLPCPEEPEVPPTGSAPIAGRGDIRDLSPYHTRTNLDTPPIIEQIDNMLTMGPYIEFDESQTRVKKTKYQALVVQNPLAIRIKIKHSRSQATIKTEFGWILGRPAVADMYRAGNALRGPFQTCIVHLDRKGEVFAIRAKDGSWEYVLWKKSNKVFRYISDVNKIITALAGGPNKTACDIGVAFRKNPALKEYADAVKDWVRPQLEAIAEAYETVDVIIVKSRKMAGSLCNALPYTCTSTHHPGMPPNTNGVERTIRQHHVRARNTYRSLPNEQAAETLSILQTIHANAQLLGITSGEMISCRNGPRDLYNTGKPPPIFGGGAGACQDNTTT